ncbi:hypothetical protein SAMN04489712_11184 [Thermomonospora echinospora]|uniref:Phage integrase family protein n=1 Tax=Thermomonospora echinospora TaxID=1992 RepID=A0A1H6CRY0_9ACTN|nr:hypothetical protein SAMN04489712_11184 [Thermomonospora echinospora]
MSARIDSYVPAGAPPAWERVAAEVRRVVTVAEPLTPYRAGELMSVLARLALFADGQGCRADAQVWLSREFIERFITVGCTDVSAATRGNYRSKLLRLREAVCGPDCRSGKPVKLSASDTSKPYTPAEMTTLWTWAQGQPTEELRRGCTLLLALGRGCGLDSPEVIPLRAHDVRRHDNGAVVVTVRGRRERLVVCRRPWERVLAEEAARFRGQAAHLFRPGLHARAKNTITGFLARTHDAPGTPALKMSRLRTSWLVELIEGNLPLPVIVAAAGVDTLHGLSRVLPYVKGASTDRAAELLRGKP